MADDGRERTEQPTSRRREEARKEGKTASSREVSSFFVILGSAVVLYFSGLWIATGLMEMMKKSFFIQSAEMTPRDVTMLLQHLTFQFMVIALPVFFIPLFGAVSYVLQNGFALSGKPLAPDFSRINPLSGARRLLSLNSVAELVKSLLKISVIGYVVYTNVAGEWNRMPFLIDADVGGSAVYIAAVTYRIMIKTVWVLAAIAALDYLYQRWQFEQGLKMSKQEIKEEMKELEGDPMIKARVRSIQKEIARKRMMQAVPTADVVVTNPTHLAVALKYDRAKDKAPKVVAKGAGFVAARIRELAGKHGVPVMENKPLAQGLFKNVEIGKEIPAALYKAVAEILAYVYRLKPKFRM